MLKKIGNAVRKGVEFVKEKSAAVAAALVVTATVAAPQSAHAQSATTFDPSTATSSLSGAVTTASAIVAGLVALGAGVAVYKKVKGFFAKSN